MPDEIAIDEPIKVWVMFDPSTDSASSLQASSGGARLFPIAMNWRRQLVKFEKLVFIGARRVGDVKFLNLVCSSGTANFELEYNSNNHAWKLKKMMPRE